MKRITIYDVAKEADVSLATVSRVINDSNVVREDTRMRVQQAIEKLGYKPNAIAQGLALSKTTTISIVMSEKLFAYNAKILNGLMDVAKIYNYNIMFHTTSKGISKMQDVIESIIKSRVDGVILFNDNFSEDEMEVDEETGELIKPFVMPMQGTEIGHIIAFLRNNDITAEPDDESLNDLKGEFTDDYELRRKAKADKILAMSEAETEQQNWI